MYEFVCMYNSLVLMEYLSYCSMNEIFKCVPISIENDFYPQSWSKTVTMTHLRLHLYKKLIFKFSRNLLFHSMKLNEKAYPYKHERALKMYECDCVARYNINVGRYIICISMYV